MRFGIRFVATLPDGTTKRVLRRRDENDRPWTTRSAAQKALREALTKVDRGDYVDPSKVLVGAYLDEWAKGLRLGASTVSGYEKNIRLHIRPALGALPLASVTGARISAFYRELESSGRKDHRPGEGLSARSVRQIHTILHKAFGVAVRDGLLIRNPADRADPPTTKEARAPEMRPWNHAQLRTFLGWSKENSDHHAAWFVLAMTGVRRGELLALRWRDVDFDARTMAVRRSATLVKTKGRGETLNEGPTKTSKARVIDLDDDTVTLLKAHRRERAALALQHGRDEALVFADHEGDHLHPERFSRTFKATVKRCRKKLARIGQADLPPDIRLHDLRHTHATVLLSLGTHPKIVSERLGHSSISITLDTYSHVLPTIQREAVERLAMMMTSGRKTEARRIREGSGGHSEPIQ
ncbi:tyrosine-type recombinase/integrase [Marinactinospora rubrisoli]|uniref:Tyrosine-type recombinase/integrase n=1 Tax=Marinactinospora rubrisoli TaxID=2715399 RepID=A0ABW2KBC7_9ACTN